MEKKSKLILSADESFARRVALGVIVRRPLKAWQQLIPGMFIFDFLRRNSEIRRFSHYFLFPRRLAMETALHMTRDEPMSKGAPEIHEKTRAWLEISSLYGNTTHQSLIALVNLIIEHYIKLLQAHGENHYELVTESYGDRVSYGAHLQQLASLEREFDRAVMEKLGVTEALREKIHTQQQVAGEQRRKELDAIFLV